MSEISKKGLRLLMALRTAQSRFTDTGTKYLHGETLYTSVITASENMRQANEKVTDYIATLEGLARDAEKFARRVYVTEHKQTDDSGDEARQWLVRAHEAQEARQWLVRAHEAQEARQWLDRARETVGE